MALHIPSKNSAEITKSHTVSEINALLGFMQKFKMATRNGQENNFLNKNVDNSAYTLQAKNYTEITLFHIVSKIDAFFSFMHHF